MFRKARGLTQLQLADQLGKSVETISNFERGKTLIGLLTLESLARHLDVGMKDFFDDNVGAMAPPGGSSNHAKTVRNAADLHPKEDLEIIAGLIKVLRARRRKGPK